MPELAWSVGPVSLLEPCVAVLCVTWMVEIHKATFPFAEVREERQALPWLAVKV